MSLADVIVPLDAFDRLYQHLLSYKPNKVNYKNMHMREARRGPDGNELRYLHAMRARPGTVKAIDGMISGPSVLWGYELLRTRSQTQLVITIDEADEKAVSVRSCPFLTNAPASDRSERRWAARRHVGRSSKTRRKTLAASFS